MDRELASLESQIAHLWWEYHDLVETNITLQHCIDDISTRQRRLDAEAERKDVYKTRESDAYIGRNIELEQELWEFAVEEKEILLEMEEIAKQWVTVAKETRYFEREESSFELEEGEDEADRESGDAKLLPSVGEKKHEKVIFKLPQNLNIKKIKKRHHSSLR
ncbi:hypothetical protein RUND412_005227 [Rhizina undulata]